MNEQKTILEPSLIVFGFLLQDAFDEGYRISEQDPVTFFGGQYHVIMVKKAVAEKQQEASKPGRPAKAK